MGNLHLINTFYDRGEFNRDFTGKSHRIREDFIQLNVKDCDNNETNLVYIEKPMISFYKTRSLDPNRYKFHQMSLPITELVRINTLYRDRTLKMAESANIKAMYFQAMKEGYMSRKNFEQTMLNSPFFYCADMDIEDYFINEFMEKNGRDVFKEKGVFRHGFLDIEVDIYEYNGKLDSKAAAVPISLITYYDKYTSSMYAFALVNQDNPDIVDIMQNKEKFIAEYVIPEAHEDLTCNIAFFENERELLSSFWAVLHRLKPDFVGIWNMNFDIPFILNRMSKLGMDKLDCCHPSVEDKYKVCKYIEDPDRDLTVKDKIMKKGNTPPSRLWDWCNISGYTQFYDQMALYSIIRKRYLLPSYKLDDIAETETGYGKLDYHKFGYNIRNLSRKNYKMFLSYGIIDTLRLKQIEDRTNDLWRQILFADNTRVSKSVSVSYTIKNMLYRFYYDKNPRQIIGNNVSYNFTDRIEGALVAQTDKLRLPGLDYMNSGNPSTIYEEICDFDFSSLYPSVMISFNISKSTLWGKMYGIVDKDNMSMGDSKELASMLQTLDTSLFDLSEKYLKLPSINNIMKEIEDLALRNTGKK